MLKCKGEGYSDSLPLGTIVVKGKSWLRKTNAGVSYREQLKELRSCPPHAYTPYRGSWRSLVFKDIRRRFSMVLRDSLYHYRELL